MTSAMYNSVTLEYPESSTQPGKASPKINRNQVGKEGKEGPARQQHSPEAL